MTWITTMVWSLTQSQILWSVKWALGSITMNKVSVGHGIPAELFQVLKDGAVKVLHSVCQRIWKTQQWPQDWKRRTMPKKDSAKEYSDCCTVAPILNASKVMLKILQARLQQYVTQRNSRCTKWAQKRQRRVRMGNTCIPMADPCECMAKPPQYCKVISLQLK